MKALLDEESRSFLMKELVRTVDFVDVKNYLEEKNIYINDKTISQACTALNAGKNIILYGPPGTGKTELAEALVNVAEDADCCQGGVFTTATDDWTTFDTIGGYMPVKSEGGGLEFVMGQFLEAIKDDKWLVIDELNRASIDKAFGPLLTVLSKKSVQLSFYEGDRRVKIEYERDENSPNAYIVKKDWKIIGTMNDVDKLSLYNMSYAFQRRFAQIYVGIPDNYEEIIKRFASKYDIEEVIQNIVINICKKFRDEKELGPAIIIDIFQYISEKDDQKEGLVDAIELFVMPQLDIIDKKAIEKIFNDVFKEESYIKVKRIRQLGENKITFIYDKVETVNDDDKDQSGNLEISESKR